MRVCALQRQHVNNAHVIGSLFFSSVEHLIKWGVGSEIAKMCIFGCASVVGKGEGESLVCALFLCFLFLWSSLIWIVVMDVCAGAECPSLCSWLSPKWLAPGDSLGFVYVGLCACVYACVSCPLFYI